MQAVVRRNECVLHSNCAIWRRRTISAKKRRTICAINWCMDVTMTVSEKKLFREETLTLQTARQIATTHEAARQNMNLFRGQQQTHDSATVNKVMKVKADKRVSPRQCSTEVRRIVPGKAKWKFCGREHACDRKQCPAFGKKCHTCGRENHFVLNAR